MANDIMDTLSKIPVSVCSCKACQRMCRRPCFGTPDDIQKLIDAGHADRLCLEHHCGLTPKATIPILTPALKGQEGKKSPCNPASALGCTFWHYGKCKLHNIGLKPLGAKLVDHNTPYEANEPIGGKVGANVAELWKSEEAQAMVKRWCDERGLTTEQEIPSIAEMIKFIMSYPDVQ